MQQAIAIYKKNYKKSKWQLSNVFFSLSEAEKYAQSLKDKYFKMGFEDVQTVLQPYTNTNINEIPEILIKPQSEKNILS